MLKDNLVLPCCVDSGRRRKAAHWRGFTNFSVDRRSRPAVAEAAVRFVVDAVAKHRHRAVENAI